MATGTDGTHSMDLTLGDQSEAQALVLLVSVVIVAATTFGVLITTVVQLQAENSEPEDSELIVTGQSLTINDPNASGVSVSDGIDDEGTPVAYELRLELQSTPDSSVIDLTELQISLRSGNTGSYQHLSQHTEDGELIPEGEVNGTAVARGVYFIRPTSAAELNGSLAPGESYELIIPIGVAIDDDGSLWRSPSTPDRVAAPNQNNNKTRFRRDIADTLDSGEMIDNSGLGLLEPGDELSLTVATAEGATRTIDLQVPAQLETDAGETISI